MGMLVDVLDKNNIFKDYLFKYFFEMIKKVGLRIFLLIRLVIF